MDDRRKQREKDYHKRLYADDPAVREPAAKYYSIAGETRRHFTDLVIRYGRGKRLLEYGCGDGSYAALYARNGAQVTGIDISEEGIGAARAAAAAAGLEVEYRVMDAERLQFEANSFDVVAGTSILHHLDLERCYVELARVLRSDGHAVFIEPLGHNPLHNLYRRMTPAMRTPDEHPFRMADLALAGEYFEQVGAAYFHLFTLLAVPLRKLPGFAPVLAALRRVDHAVLAAIPALRPYAWMAVLDLARPRDRVAAP